MLRSHSSTGMCQRLTKKDFALPLVATLQAFRDAQRELLRENEVRPPKKPFAFELLEIPLEIFFVVSRDIFALVDLASSAVADDEVDAELRLPALAEVPRFLSLDQQKMKAKPLKFVPVKRGVREVQATCGSRDHRCSIRSSRCGMSFLTSSSS